LDALKKAAGFPEFMATMALLSGDAGEDVLVLELIQKNMTKFSLFKQPNKLFSQALKQVIDCIVTIQYRDLDMELQSAILTIFQQPNILPRSFMWRSERELVSPIGAEPVESSGDTNRTLVLNHIVVKTIALDFLTPVESELIETYTELLDHNLKAISAAIYRITRQLYSKGNTLFPIDNEYAKVFVNGWNLGQPVNDQTFRTFYKCYDAVVQEGVATMTTWITGMLQELAQDSEETEIDEEVQGEQTEVKT
jgi:hypothetical protein